MLVKLNQRFIKLDHNYETKAENILLALNKKIQAEAVTSPFTGSEEKNGPPNIL